MSNETIEEKIYRLFGRYYGFDMLPNNGLDIRFSYESVCAVIEMTIAEEREAYKDEISNLKDVVASYEKQSPVAWINRDATYVELSTKSTIYGSHTIPLIVQHEVAYSSNIPEIFPGTLSALNRLIPKNEVSEYQNV